MLLYAFTFGMAISSCFRIYYLCKSEISGDGSDKIKLLLWMTTAEIIFESVCLVFMFMIKNELEVKGQETESQSMFFASAVCSALEIFISSLEFVKLFYEICCDRSR